MKTISIVTRSTASSWNSAQAALYQRVVHPEGTPIIIPAAATSPGRRPPVRITAEIAFIGCTGSGKP